MSDALRLAEEVAAGFAERAAEHDRDASFPAEDFRALRETGLLGLMVPAELGGMGAGFEEYVRVAAALARGNGSTALIFNMHASVTGGLAAITEEMAQALGVPGAFFARRAEALRAAAEGALYGVAITEAGVGSRLSALRATYRRENGGYRIAGTKVACSGAGHHDALLVAARAAASDDPRISFFLVPMGEGVAVRPGWDPLGMRATASHAVELDAIVGEDALVGGVEGLALLIAEVMPQWLVASYAAVYVGVAEAALEAAAVYLRDRVVAGESGALSHLPAVRARLGRADALAHAARLAVEQAARLVDLRPGDRDTNRAVYRAKLLAGDAVMEVAGSLAEACGLAALRRGEPLERLFRDARMGAVMPPSSDVSAEWLGVAVLGLDPGAEGVRPW